jgi:hypothetical protein
VVCTTPMVCVCFNLSDLSFTGTTHVTCQWLIAGKYSTQEKNIANHSNRLAKSRSAVNH